MNWIQYVVQLLFIGAAVFLADVVRPYLKKRAEDYATLQAIDKNTKAVEEVRKVFSKEIETVKATLQKQVHSHNLFKQKQMEVSLGLWNQMVKLQSEAIKILTLIKFEWNTPDFVGRLDTLEKHWAAAIEEFRQAAELGIPFQPDEINKIIERYDKGQIGLVKKILEKIRLSNERICGSHDKLMQELESDWKSLRRVYLDAGKDLFQKLEHIYVVDLE
jgi:hypothetical protein